MISNFPNDKKTFLAKLDKSKKKEIDERVMPLLKIINALPDYYTTSSCSGRVYLWSGHEKKNTVERLKVSHDLIDKSFFEPKERSGPVWLRLEDLILHVCCKDLGCANRLLTKVRKLYKKSCILSASNKIIVEIRGSESIEMPLFLDQKPIFFGDYGWLAGIINQRLKSIWKKEKELEKEI